MSDAPGKASMSDWRELGLKKARECLCLSQQWSATHYDGPQPDCPAHGIDAEALRWLHGMGLCPAGNRKDLMPENGDAP